MISHRPRTIAPSGTADPVSTGLPFLDEHRIRISASPSEVWETVLDCVRVFDKRPARLYAAVVRARPRRKQSIVPMQGSSLPGFTVTRVDRERALVLSGRHLFSQYAMAFLIDAGGPRTTTVRVQSYATFPGPHGAMYRLTVFGTGIHRVLLHRLLRTIKRRSTS